MCWKNVKTYLRSIRIRLALLYSLSAFIVMLLIATCLYWEALNILHKANYQFLSDEANTIRSLLNQKTNNTILKKVVIDIPNDTDNSIYRYFVRLVDDKGRSILETPGIEQILPINKNIGSFSLFENTRYGMFTAGKRHYLLIKTPFSNLHKMKGQIQIALDITHQHKVIEDRQIIFISFLLITLLAFVIGLFVSHKGMQSLYTLTETTRKITIESISKRIDPKHWPNELRELGFSFNQMLCRIESSIMQLKQFSADLAHELRTPINNMIGQTEIALSYPHATSDYQHILTSNLEEMQRMSQLIENILFLARAENPELKIDKIKINVSEEIKMIQEYYEALAQEKSITVNCNGEAEMNANLIMFRRVISNLLSNALKYTDVGGQIDFSVTEINNNIQLQISDTGRGIDAQHLPKIFERFYRVDHARSQELGGVGLGLAIVKSIVELHYGSIKIISEPNIGTTVYLEFPKY